MDKKYINNAIILSLYFFQYSLFMFIMNYITPSYIVTFTSFLLLLIFFYINKSNFILNLKIIIFILFMFNLFLLKINFQLGNNFDIFFYFISLAIPGLLISTSHFDKDYFFYLSYKLSIINFILNCGIPFISSHYDYMRFGYGLVPTVVFSYLFIKNNQIKRFSIMKLIHKIILFFSSVEILIYGCRGSFFASFLFILFDIFFIERKLKTTLVSLFILGVVYNNIKMFIIIFINFLVKNFNIHSYFLYKLKMMLSGKLIESSSGRWNLYVEAFKNIKAHPIVGNPLCKPILGEPFVHNLFLQIANDFGIIALIIFIYFFIKCLNILNSKFINIKDKMILNIFMATSIGRLTFSSTLWRRPEFWLFVGFAIIIFKNKSYVCNST